MKLHLLLLASVFSLSSGFMAELKGPLAGEEICIGNEYADFKTCINQGIATDINLAGIVDDEDIAIVTTAGDERKMSCSGCPSGAPRGTWCFTMCGSRRRLLEEGTGTPNLRRVQESNTAVFEGGLYTGNAEAILILSYMTTCLDNGSTNHPCLGTSDTMKLTVTL
jgi:hypothetical protein